MSNREKIDQIVEQLKALLPGEQLSASLEKNLRAVVQSSLAKFDVVSKEEFEAQQAVLQRSREKIEQLEQQLAQLSQQFSQLQQETKH